MKRKIFYILILFSLLFKVNASVAQKEVDSLINSLTTLKNDTIKLSVLDKIIEKSIDDQIWPKYNEQLAELSFYLMKSKVLKIKQRAMYYYANSQLNTGYLYNSKGNLDSSIVYYNKAMEIMKRLGDKAGMAAALNNIGYAYKSQGDILSALDCYHKSLKLYENAGDDNGIANTLNNLAIIYHRQGDYKTAISYNLKSLSLNEKIGDKRSIAISMNSLALLYSKKNKPEVALSYLKKALKMQEEIMDKGGIANSYNNIGYILNQNNDYKEALKNYLLAYNIATSAQDKSVLVSAAINIAATYLKLNNIEEAFKYAKEAYDLAMEIGYVDELGDAADLMSKVYKIKKEYKNALQMHEFYMTMRDSALNESTKNASLQMKYQYSYEKKAAADSLKNHDEQMVKDAEISAQKSALSQEQTKKYILFAGLTLFVLLSVYTLYRYKDTQKKNRIIEHQKEIVDEKQKEIIDSITYAKRIQMALLKEEEHVSKHLPAHFVIYQPKDIVSGDFYWSLEKADPLTKQKYWYITVADCTGHGVPGAFLTLLGTSFLNEINATAELLSPSEILNQLRSRFIKDLNQSGKIGESKDGMDMSIIRFNLSTKEIEWAGANHPLWLIKNVVNKDPSFIEIKGNKSPIGFSDHFSTFTNHSLQLSAGDQLLLFTDGFVDQFGGEKKKKFKRAQFKELILSVACLPANQQKKSIEKAFEEWRKGMEQVDDVCIIGIRI